MDSLRRRKVHDMDNQTENELCERMNQMQVQIWDLTGIVNFLTTCVDDLLGIREAENSLAEETDVRKDLKSL